MFKINQELLEITKKQIEMDLQDLNRLQYARIENFRKFVNNQAKSKNDLITIHFAVHDLKQQIGLELAFTKGFTDNETVMLIFKEDVINIYYSETTHFLSCL